MDNITVEEFKNNDEVRIVILTYRGEDDPVRNLDEAIRDYAKGRFFWEFVDINMDNPWTRIIVFNTLKV